MYMRVLTPRRPQQAPVAGTFVSVTAHAALLVAVGGGDGPASARPEGRPPARAAAPASEPEGEQLHWVGLGSGGGGVAAPRPGARPNLPPIAYVVPGRGTLRVAAPGEHRPGPGRARAADRRSAGAAASPPATDVRRPGPRSAPPAPRLRTAALPDVVLPDVAMPDAAASLLVAGVLSSAPDLARRASRPEDFVPVPTARFVAELMTRTGVGLPFVLRPNLHVDDLPIPLVDNPPPAYPAALERARVGGQVVVEFLIDSTGAVDVASLRVVQSTNALFTQAVRGVLPQMRFTPAQLNARSVGVTVRQPFLFTVRSGL